MLRHRYKGLSHSHESDGQLVERERAKPLVTYGKERPLALTADQFLRRSVFDFPSDDETEQPAIYTARPEVTHQEVDDDSPLSGAEDFDRNDIDDNEDEHSIGLPPTSEIFPRIPKITKPRLRPRKNPRSNQASIRQQPEAQSRGGSQLRALQTGDKDPKTRFGPENSRRLPTKELILVNSPPQVHVGESATNIHGEQQESINDQFTSSNKRRSSSTSSEQDGTEQKISLTSIRKRLQTPRLKYKTINPTERPIFALDASIRTKGDGFEECEMSLPVVPRRKRHNQKNTHFLSGFRVLQLSSGPLPAVKFSSSETTDSSHATHQSQSSAQGGAVSLKERSLQQTQTLNRKVSFSQRDEFIMAQLSSLSVPERPPLSDSEESDNDEEFDEDDKENEDVETHDEGDDNQELMSESEDEAEEEAEEPFDGRKSHGSTQNIPRSLVNQPVLDNQEIISDDDDEMILDHEYDEILDFDNQPPSSMGPSRNSPYLGAGSVPRDLLRPERLVEVDDAISDEPEQSIVQVVRSDTVPQSINSQPSRSMRRPSILKNKQQGISANTTDLRDTAANTRRNSFIEVTESRYFEKAAEMLQSPDQILHPGVPRRKSSRYSEYQSRPYHEPEDEEEEEDPAALEADYIQSGQLSVLRKNSETMWMWTSSSLPSTLR